MDTGALTRKIVLIYAAALVFLGIIFFVPAGTFDYWQAWAYMAVVLVPAAAVMAYFLKKDPEFLERRFQTREKEARQQAIIKAALGIFIVAFIVPGLDRRFGWSVVPPEISIAADALVFLGYIFVFLVFRVNSYAGRTIRVEKGQKVVSTGPYSIVRHPMYLGSVIMYMATPIALGSYFAFPLFLLIIPVFVFRILNEEEVLRRDLPGYAAYCEKTKYRLLPLIW